MEVGVIIDVVQVAGLAEFRRGLRDMDRAAPRALRLAGNEAAALVVDTAGPMMPRKSGRAQESVKARSSQSVTRVVSGGARAPYVPWLDYGGNVGVNDTAHRAFMPDGRYVYPAFRRVRPQFETVLMTALQRIAAESGVTLGG
jgi:hypothetical protein